MNLKSLSILSLGVLLLVPVVTYFTIWWGVTAYHRAKTYCKQLDEENSYDNNSNRVNEER